MNNNQDQTFYVGYMPNAPPNLRGFLRTIVFGIFIVMVSVAALVSFNQKEFSTGTFEYGTYTEVTGYIDAEPYPMLRVPASDNAQFKSLLLINFGKMGVRKIIDDLEAETKGAQHYVVTIRGTLIYYDGKTALELSEGRESIVSWMEVEETPNHVIIPLGEKTVTGEIVDPKCYLGVMKPGMGKVHQSCARRCISGGIPPVMIAQDQANKVYQLLVTDTDGNPLNDELLDFVGPKIQVSGIVEQKNDWLIIKTNPTNQIIPHASLSMQIEGLLTYLFPEPGGQCRLHPTAAMTQCL